MSAFISVSGSAAGTALQSMLMSDEIVPGQDPSYQLCKLIYVYHPLGKKMADSPIAKAMSQDRKISIPNGPEEKVREAFQAEWEAIGADKHIANVMSLSRVYGIASVVYGAKGVPTDRPIDPKELAKLDLYFNIADPLNTAGSLVLDQNPNSPMFQKHAAIAISGQQYHRSRSCTIMNEEPIYIEYTTSAYGFVGRSVYQRALFPLKTFVQSMITDDMITRKGGLLIAMIKTAGSIVDNMMAKFGAIKRNLLKQAQTNNVLEIGTEESIESLDLKNSELALTTARKNVLENCAAAADMPAVMLNSETFAEGFGEGTEDAKNVAAYIDGIRKEMRPLYSFFDFIVMYRAWNEEFYKTIQAQFEEYKDVPYIKAFHDWKNCFKTEWPSLLIEPESKLVEVDKVKLEAIVKVIEVMTPQMDPENRAAVMMWAADNINAQKMMFTTPLMLDKELLEAYEPPAPPEPSPESKF